MKSSVAVFAVVVVVLAIGAFFFLHGSRVTDQAATVSFTPIAEGTTSKVATRVDFVITSPEDLQKLWSMIDATNTPPSIDFNTQAVLAVFLGEQPTTGYGIRISKIVDGQSRLVSVTVQKPSSTCTTEASVTKPYELVVVPVTSLPLTHQDNSTTVNCP